MGKGRLKIGLLCASLAASQIAYGLFFNKFDGFISEEVYFGILMYVLLLWWYLWRKYRSKDDADTKG